MQQTCTECGQQLRQTAAARSVQRVGTVRKRLKSKPGAPKAVVIIFTSIALTSALGQGFYNQPRLSVGKTAPETIVAPADGQVEDVQATEAKRKTARSGSALVLMTDPIATEQIRQSVQTALLKGSTLRQQVGRFPFLETGTLSEPIQRYLQRAEDWEWRLILDAVQGRSVQLADPLQRKAVDELSRSKSQGANGLSTLTNRVMVARQRYTSTIALLQAPYDTTLFEVSDPAWQKTQTEITQALDRMLTQGIPPGLPPSQLEAAINLQLTTPETKAIATRILLTSLRPNLIKDEAQTREFAEKAAQTIEPVMITVRQGELIARRGQTITARDFIWLDHFKLSRRETNWFGLIGLGGLVSAAIVLFWQIEQHFYPKGLRTRDYWLIWLMTVSTPLLVIVGAPSTNLPAIGFLMGTFYGSLLALTGVGLLTVLLPIGLGISVMQWLPSAVAGALVAAIASRVRSREELAFLGLGVGLVQGTLYLILGAMSGPIGYGLFGRAALNALTGLAWSIVAIGISPYIEHLFDVVTTLRLVELANPNRTLLKRLAAETPGTFQHTLFVANLAEAAARSLGCHVELVRAGTLYHDIGKMHDPLGFIENQMGGVNKHDVINDPWRSAEIIKKHVSEGLVMARRARLPRVVQAFIPEHQGTMTIAYFHYQAKQRAEADPAIVLDDAAFRYDGPTPQSRETAIVMLADSAEAALRSLKDATPDEALNMINKILAARWKDGQLDDSGLTREEMGAIAKVFVQVWQQSNHQRIAYPKSK